MKPVAVLELAYAAFLIGLGIACIIVGASHPLPENGTWERVGFIFDLMLGGAIATLGAHRMIRSAVIQGIEKAGEE